MGKIMHWVFIIVGIVGACYTFTMAEELDKALKSKKEEDYE